MTGFRLAGLDAFQFLKEHRCPLVFECLRNTCRPVNHGAQSGQSDECPSSHSYPVSRKAEPGTLWEESHSVTVWLGTTNSAKVPPSWHPQCSAIRL
jgi:hypothetical protein